MEQQQQQKTYDFFLGHSGTNATKNFARYVIQKALEDKGHSVFCESSCLQKESLPESLKALNKSKVYLLFLDEAASLCPFVRSELTEAKQANKHIVAVYNAAEHSWEQVGREAWLTHLEPLHGGRLLVNAAFNLPVAAVNYRPLDRTGTQQQLEMMREQLAQVLAMPPIQPAVAKPADPETRAETSPANATVGGVADKVVCGAGQEKLWDFFIGHTKNSKDTKTVDFIMSTVRSTLMQRGHRVFFDEHDLKGKPIAECVNCAGKSIVHVVVLDDRTPHSPWVVQEIQASIAAGNPLVALYRVDEFKWSEVGLDLWWKVLPEEAQKTVLDGKTGLFARQAMEFSYKTHYFEPSKANMIQVLEDTLLARKMELSLK